MIHEHHLWTTGRTEGPTKLPSHCARLTATASPARKPSDVAIAFALPETWSDNRRRPFTRPSIAPTAVNSSQRPPFSLAPSGRTGLSPGGALYVYIDRRATTVDLIDASPRPPCPVCYSSFRRARWPALFRSYDFYYKAGSFQSEPKNRGIFGVCIFGRFSWPRIGLSGVSTTALLSFVSTSRVCIISPVRALEHPGLWLSESIGVTCS